MMLVQALVMMGVVAVPVIAPLLAVEFDLPRDFAGGFQSLAFLGAAMMTVVAGTLVGRYGGVRMSQICCALTAVGVLLPVSGHVSALFIGALLAGAGYGMATPGASHVLARVATASTRGLVFSIKQSAVTLGGLFAGLVVPAVAETAGWQMALSVVAVLAIVAIVVIQPVRRRLDDDRDAARPLTFSAVAENVALVWRHPRLRPVSVAAFVYAGMQVGLFALYVTLLVGQIGLGLIEAGKLYAIMQGTGVVFRIAWGSLSDRGVDARRLLAFLGLGSIVFTLILAVADASWSWSNMVLVSIGIGATTISWNGIYLAEIPRQVPQAQVSAATAGTVMFSFAGVVAGPVTFSVIAVATGSYLPAFVVFNVATLACVIYLLRTR